MGLNIHDLIGGPVNHRFIPVEGAQIHLAEAGSGAPLILLHGLNIGWLQWYPNIAALAKRYHVFAFDLPGAGESTVVDFTRLDPERMLVNTIDACLRTLGINDVTIVGHSLGAWVAMRLLNRGSLSIRRLILTNPFGFSDFTPPLYRMLASEKMARLLATTMMSPSDAHLRKFFEMVVRRRSTISSALIGQYAANIAAAPETHPFYLIHRLTGFRKVRPEFILDRSALTALQGEVIFGEYDPIVPPVTVPENVAPQVRRHVIRGVGHVPNIESADEWNAIVCS